MNDTLVNINTQALTSELSLIIIRATMGHKFSRFPYVGTRNIYKQGLYSFAHCGSKQDYVNIRKCGMAYHTN